MLKALGATHGILRATTIFQVTTASIAMVAAMTASTAQAQVAPPTNLASVCSGVSLPRSVVTDIMRPVIGGVVAPVQGTVNSILGIPLIGTLLPLVPQLSIDATGLLNTAASGQNIRLQAVATDGTLIGPGTPCNAQADSLTLTNPAGLSIGGNRITGLGAAGNEAFASSIDAIAFGDLARTDAAAAIAIGTNASVGAGGAGSVALGSGASATSANSVALGAGSIASRGVPEVSIGAPGAERVLTNLAAGTAPTDAVNFGQLTTVAGSVTALADRAVQYDDATRARITLGGGAGGTVIGNVTPGTLSAASTEAVNGAQLFATNQAVAGNTTAITNLTTQIANLPGATPGPVRYSDAAAPTVPNGGTPTNDVTLVGATAGAVGLHNVAAGALGVGSTDAVNGDQLNATNQAVAGNTTAITNLGTQVTTNTTDIANLTTQVGTNTTNIANLTTQVGANTTNIGNLTTRVDGNTTAIANINTRIDATDASITNINTSIGATNTAITNLTTQVSNGAIGPVRYSDPGSPETPNGGVPTNNLTLVGANAGAVGLHNVAGGRIAAGSTDAVNGGQVFALAAASVNAVTYDTDTTGTRTNTITLAGGTAAAPVTITNVAAGALGAGSTDAVNGAQLAATNTAVTAAQGTATTALTNAAAAQGTANTALANAATAQGTANTAITNAAAAQGTANTALALGRNSVQYDSVGGSVTLNPTGAAAALRNVAAGVAATDAVNVAQLQNAAAGAVQYDRTSTGAIDRTSVTFGSTATGAVQLHNIAAGTSGLDAVNLNQLRALDFDLRNNMNGLRTEAQRGTAVALAANGMRFDDRAGRTSVGAAVSVYRGETGLALGLGHTSRNQRLRYNGAVSFSPNGGKNVGAVAGATFSFGDD